MTPDLMPPNQVQALFTRKDGTYLFARWGRPIVPVVFGVDDATLSVVKGAIEADRSTRTPTPATRSARHRSAARRACGRRGGATWRARSCGCR